jgi:membrane peptidoglycan carboxypeptidase
LTGFAGASSRYFCIGSEELSLAQTAAVGALSIAPNSYPSNEAQWRVGRHRILTWMMVEGDVAAGDAEAAMAEPLAPCGG